MFSEDQFRIDSAIVDAISECIPEGSQSACLVIERSDPQSEFRASIESPTGKSRVKESVFSAAEELDGLFLQKGKSLKRATYNVDYLEGSARWTVQFEQFAKPQ